MKYIYEQITKKDGITLRGVINTPDDFDALKEYPTVIMYHGFGGDRNGSTWMRTQNSTYLTKRGYVVVRFDFSGTNESDGEFYDMTVSREVEEAMMIYDFTKLREYVDKNRIYLVGHSLGGVISTLIADKVKPKAMVLLAPASDMNNLDYIKVAATSYFDNSQTSEDLDLLNVIKKVHEMDDVDIGGAKLSKNFLIDFIKKDIYGQASKYQGNVLIIRGTNDQLVFNDANVKLNDSYPHSIYEQIEGADHSFKNYDHRMIMFDKMYKFLEEN
jgi:dipeptidylaminopeptidase/acylaminoacyl-peptidase-like protein